MGKKGRLELNNQGVKIGLPKQQLILWETIQSYSLDRAKDKLTIDFFDLGKIKKIDVDLWRYQIEDYRDFEKVITIYVERFFERWKYRSINDN